MNKFHGLYKAATVVFLPPASEGWGRYCFHRCLSLNKGKGYHCSLVPGLWSQVLSRRRRRGTSGFWSHVLSGVRGQPIGLGYPSLYSDQNRGTRTRKGCPPDRTCHESNTVQTVCILHFYAGGLFCFLYSFGSC